MTPAAMLVAGICASGGAQAIDIGTGHPDVTVRWDQTVKLNTGVRLKEIDPAIGNNPSNDESDYRVKKNGITSARVDLFSELEIAYKREFGARLSGAAWYDQKYDDHRVMGNPALAHVPKR